ncbi:MULTISPECIES: LytTR family DNA-binding domain-containing protein [unclassified Gemella]|uniref:LytTR family DNA-binding domain-containing protein n=1 Tax=unclassified Gemella TaxID=2624949 RepID=UPI001073269B|nr:MULTISPECIES: LytTR family DNA-binding domain-containing protein [unclassified Gemella]MBF0710766.1 LytTR family transcriptional regulator DNA-binding domain-containing protein [Gemella sp. GL1.1]MBF0746665.1 LytTR family transcriptional regulator DNA-binding domain-containing protein [Gemella sp. 19428wG2_WT2a]NYS28110.1 LytTR family transcriptional regulator DNA-binding domain-containing protein [Gemella sp. GL1]TFU60015.1 LytTR family transcriptional regulator [Gemella sp. WT2a]
MKLELFTDSSTDEKIIKIYTNKIDEKIQKIIDIVNSKQNTIVAYRDKEAQLLDENFIERIFIEDRKIKIYYQTKTYISKLKLYEIEKMLTDDFIKISQSEIVNIKYVKKLDFSYSGTIKLIFKNGIETFVSRRSIKEFKNKLGI